MAISIFARANESEPWSSILTGMFSSLQPVKQSSKPDESSAPPPSTTSPKNASLGGATRRQPIVSRPGERAIKRRRVTIDEDGPSTQTKRKPALKAARKRATLTSVVPPTNTIDRYFTSGDSQQSDDSDKPPVSLYDAIQQRVHEAESRSQAKRTLRSQDEGSRLKSELAPYFPNFDVIMNDTPTEPDVVTADSVLIFKEGPRKAPLSSILPRTVTASASPVTARSQPLAGYNGAQIIDFSVIEKNVPHHPQDQLSDAVFFKAHRRAERREKQLRNIEKERAMHEKVQLERLLEGLYGHDWLRVMGVSGITESEAQRYQTKREYFIREVGALVRKFKEWKEEEKRLKLGKDALSNERTEDEGEDEAEESIDEGDQTPTSSEINASAARQLQLEASGGNKTKTKSRIRHEPIPIFFRPPTPEGPFTSFFDKPHHRVAALSKYRSGRKSLAFGQPIPDVGDEDFDLPADYVTPANLKECARRRRRMKRESLIDTTS